MINYLMCAVLLVISIASSKASVPLACSASEALAAEERRSIIPDDNLFGDLLARKDLKALSEEKALTIRIDAIALKLQTLFQVSGMAREDDSALSKIMKCLADQKMLIFAPNASQIFKKLADLFIRRKNLLSEEIPEEVLENLRTLLENFFTHKNEYYRFCRGACWDSFDPDYLYLDTFGKLAVFENKQNLACEIRELAEIDKLIILRLNNQVNPI